MFPLIPTPYPKVNALLGILLEGVQTVLGTHFLGMYLFGSLAIGDFDGGSDIDVAVITDAEISDDVFLAVRFMHERIALGDSPWATQLEVSYLSKSALFRYDPTNARHPQLERGSGVQLVMENHARVVERHVLRERGIVVAGPPLQNLIEPVSPDDLRKSVVEILHEWAEPMLDGPIPFDTRGYQSYTVLSLCRMLYTIEHDTVVSKPVAARWAEERLGERWLPLIESARVGRQNPELAPEWEDVSGTLDLIRYALAKSQSSG
jgi:hypothetical protein